MADKKKKKSNKGFSVAFVTLIVLVILILFLVKKDTIITNLKETHFFDRVFGSTPEFVEKHPAATPTPEDLEKETTVTIKVESEKPKAPAEKPASQKETVAEKTTTEVPEITAPKEPKTENKPANPKTEEKQSQSNTTTVTTEVTYTELQLCFIEIDPDGRVIRKMVKRSIPKNDSPLATALKLLLDGPDTTKSAEKNCMSLIPSGTKLLGIKIQNGVAYLDFNENFEFNFNGVEGYNAQLMQIVYTATSFSTVKSVQFLIEGQKKEYLGSEGQWIGSPLSRNSF